MKTPRSKQRGISTRREIDIYKLANPEASLGECARGEFNRDLYMHIFTKKLIKIFISILLITPLCLPMNPKPIETTQIESPFDLETSSLDAVLSYVQKNQPKMLPLTLKILKKTQENHKLFITFKRSPSLTYLQPLFTIISNNLSWNFIKKMNLEDELKTFLLLEKIKKQNPKTIDPLRENFKSKQKKLLQEFSQCKENREEIEKEGITQACVILIKYLETTIKISSKSMIRLYELNKKILTHTAMSDEERKKTYWKTMECIGDTSCNECAICETGNYDYFEHKRCCEFIEDEEKSIKETIQVISAHEKANNFNDTIARSMVFNAVREACGNRSIFEYTLKNGHPALKNLFDTVGNNALMQYIAYACEDGIALFKTDSDQILFF